MNPIPLPPQLAFGQMTEGGPIPAPYPGFLQRRGLIKPDKIPAVPAGFDDFDPFENGHVPPPPVAGTGKATAYWVPRPPATAQHFRDRLMRQSASPQRPPSLEQRSPLVDELMSRISPWLKQIP